MTIAAIGAVVLGHVGEAAAFAFPFSVADALEDRAMGRAQQGLVPVPLTDPARIASPGATSIGIDSPVIAVVSTHDRPEDPRVISNRISRHRSRCAVDF